MVVLPEAFSDGYPLCRQMGFEVQNTGFTNMKLKIRWYFYTKRQKGYYQMKKMFAWFSPGGILFILIGCLLFLLAFEIKDIHDDKAKKCTFETEAVVEQIVKGHDNDNERTYMAVYSYSYNGESLTVNGSESTRKPNMTEGETVKFFIDPNEPSDYYCPKEEKGHNFVFIVIVFAGVITLAAGIDCVRKEYQHNTEI